MSLEMQNRIALNNANDQGTIINRAMAEAVDANHDDIETIVIQGAIATQVTLLLARNAEIHQPLQREPGEGGRTNAAPVPVSAQVDDTDATKLIIAFNVNVVDADGTGYSITGNAATVTGVESTGSILTLTLSGPILNGETITTAYDGLGSLFNSDYPTIAAEAYTAFPVTNNVAP